MGYCSYFGKKLDPEPGRCRRTDGKKWRCSKDAYPDSKYCERHMHRGKNRSRKPVESQTLSQLQSSSSTVTSLTPSRSVSGSIQSNPLQFSITGGGNAQGSNLGSYGVGNKYYRSPLTPSSYILYYCFTESIVLINWSKNIIINNN